MNGEYPKKNTGMKVFLIISICVLALALVGVGYVLYSADQKPVDNSRYYVDDFKIMQGIAVNGLDLSGKTPEEAKQIVFDDTNKKIATAKIDIDFNGENLVLNSADLGLTSNIEEIFASAMEYGSRGDFTERTSHRENAMTAGVQFNSAITYDSVKTNALLQEKANPFNVIPKDASVKFDPKIEDKFTFEPEETGYDIDANALMKMVQDSVVSGSFAEVTAPIVTTQPQITVDMLKQNTNKLSEYSTSKLGNDNRVHNITKLSGIISGVCIMPGETWSINEAAGPRKAELGWRSAAGITGGRFVDQPGGGVCQVSSTLYNAAILAELNIAERIPHSIPSTYVPIGLDATINTGGQDLKLKNPYDFPVYIESHVKGDKIFVSIYGPPPDHDYKIEFTSKQTGTVERPASKVIEAAVTPEGDPIAPGKSVEWVKGRDGKIAAVTKVYKDSNGSVIKSEQFGSESKYRAYGEVIYSNPAVPTGDGTAEETYATQY